MQFSVRYRLGYVKIYYPWQTLCNLVVVLVVSKGKTRGTMEPVQLSQMIVAICTLFSTGKLRKAIVYSWNDDFQQILPFVDVDGDSIHAGTKVQNTSESRHNVGQRGLLT